MEGFGFAIIGIILLIIVVQGRTQEKKLIEHFKEIAHALGWQYEASTFGVGAIEGRLPVGEDDQETMFGKVDRFTEGSGNNTRTYIRFHMKLPIHNGLKVSSEGIGSSMMKLMSGEDIEVGNEDFDQKAFIQAPSELIAASYLNTYVQRALSDYFDRFDRVTLEDGDLTLLISSSYEPSERIYEVIEDCQSLANDLLRGGDRPAQRMAHHIEYDPSPSFRFKCLSLLCEYMPHAKETEEACLQALHNENAQVRLLAARYAPSDASFPVAMGIALDANEQHYIRKAAVELLVGRFAQFREKLVDGFQRLLDDHQVTVVAAALKGLSQFDELPPLSRIAHLLSDHTSLTHEGFLRVLGAFPPSPALEAALLSGLEWGEERDTILAAIGSLGRVGAATAVEPLMPLTEGLLRPRIIKVSAREAIALIQQRAGGEAGGLSMMGATDEGQLSFTHGVGGLSEEEK